MEKRAIDALRIPLTFTFHDRELLSKSEFQTAKFFFSLENIFQEEKEPIDEQKNDFVNLKLTRHQTHIVHH